MSLLALTADLARARSQSTLNSRGRVAVGRCSVVKTRDRETNPASGTPATPMAAIRQRPARVICCMRGRSIPLADATAKAVTTSYKMIPSLFRFVPTHAARVDDLRDTLSLSKEASVRGSVARLELHPKA